MKFDSKETYLAAVAEWRIQYFDIIDSIRKTKQLFKAAQRKFSKAPPIDFYNTNSAEREAYFSAYHPMEALRAEHRSLVSTATELIVERHLGRQEAGRPNLRIAEQKPANLYRISF